MNNRTTISLLNQLVEQINIETNSPLTIRTHKDGKSTANVGHYCLDQAYGGVQLSRVTNTSGAERNVFTDGFTTKKEQERLIRAFLNGLETK